jgi:hypothetical protein
MRTFVYIDQFTNRGALTCGLLALSCVVHIAICTDSLNHILATADVQQRTPRDLTQSALQISIAGGDDIYTVGCDSVDKTVISVRALVRACQALKITVASNFEGKRILLRKLLQLCDNAIRDTNFDSGSQAVKHSFADIELVTDAEVDKVGID